MAISLSHNCYGKSAVRLAKVTRHADRHDLKEVAVSITLWGDFEQVYCAGDNTPVLPTDTMKNTVYALAQKHPLRTIEEFGLTLSGHFLDHNPHLAAVQIELSETLWQRLAVSIPGNEPARHPHAFACAGNEQYTCSLTQSRDQLVLRSGLKNLVILKTADSGFSGFLRDQYTTLPETEDRILATSLEASWRYTNAAADFSACHAQIRQAVLATFAAHVSLSVQHTLYAMGEAALEECSAIDEIHLIMPNKHYLLFDLQRFALENHNEVFVPTDEPFGRIEGTLRRV